MSQAHFLITLSHSPRDHQEALANSSGDMGLPALVRAPSDVIGVIGSQLRYLAPQRIEQGWQDRPHHGMCG